MLFLGRKTSFCVRQHMYFISTFHLVKWNITMTCTQGLRYNKIYSYHSYIKGMFRWNWLFTSQWVCDGESAMRTSTVSCCCPDLHLGAHRVIPPYPCTAFASPWQMSTQWERQRFCIIMRIVLTSWNHWKSSIDHSLRTTGLQKQKGLYEGNIM